MRGEAPCHPRTNESRTASFTVQTPPQDDQRIVPINVRILFAALAALLVPHLADAGDAWDETMRSVLKDSREGHLPQASERLSRLLEGAKEDGATLQPLLAHLQASALAEARGDYEIAASHLESGMALLEKRLGNGSSDLIPILNASARLHGHLKHPERAEKRLHRALTLASNKPVTTAQQLSLLGEFYQKQGDWTQAIKFTTAAATVWEGILGADHPRMPLQWIALADLHLSQKQDELALPLLRRALVRLDEMDPKPVHHLIQSRLRLARIHGQRQEYSQAVLLMEQALATAALEPDNPLPYPVEHLRALGEYKQALADWQGAIASYLSAMALMDPQGTNPPATLPLLKPLVTCWIQAGQLDSALSGLFRLIAQAERQEKDPELPQLLLQAARIQQERHLLKDAENNQRRAIRLLVQQLGGSHADTIQARTRYAEFLQGLPDNAGLPEKRNALAMLVQERLTALSFDPGPVDGKPGRQTVAAVLAFQKEMGLPESRKLTTSALQELLRYLPPVIPDTPLPAPP